MTVLVHQSIGLSAVTLCIVWECIYCRLTVSAELCWIDVTLRVTGVPLGGGGGCFKFLTHNKKTHTHLIV